MSTYIIYKTTCLVNQKIYVGQHNTSAEDGYLGTGTIIKSAIKKYGKENFIRETIEFCTSANVNEREVYWVDKLDSTNPEVGYNLSKGGLGNRGTKLSTESKIRISKNNAKYWKGKQLNPKVINRIKKWRKNEFDNTKLYALYLLENSSGEEILICGVDKFIRENGFSKTQFYRLISGEIKEYKGYKFLRKVQRGILNGQRRIVVSLAS